MFSYGFSVGFTVGFDVFSLKKNARFFAVFHYDLPEGFFIRFEYHAVVNSYIRGSFEHGYSNATKNEPTNAQSTIIFIEKHFLDYGGRDSVFQGLQTEALNNRMETVM